MAELRKHPLTNDWIMIASHRQNRPQMPKDYCPFCPGSGKVPDNYTVHKYDNDFPALSQNPPAPDAVANDFFETAPCYGKCEVILYSPEHTVTLPELPTPHIRELVDLWAERFTEISADENMKYVFIFENRGEVVGVTMPHPHGQIYGYSFMPKKLELEVENAKKHMAEKGKCLFCDMLDHELAFEKRIIFKNEHFTVFERIQGAGVDIEVGVELLHGHGKSASLQQRAQRGNGKAFAKRRQYTASDEDEFGFHA